MSTQTQPPRGMRDFLPDDIRRREFVLGVIRGVYERYGFEPLETPAAENLETLLGKYGEEGNKLIFKILKRGEEEASGQADLALRYDLTVPLARVVAEYQAALPRYFKRYQVQPVWRADRPARGRYREFYQCDVDALGSTSMVVEVEVCSAVCEALEALGFKDFVVRVNHRQLLTGLLEAGGVPGVLHGDALVALDKLDKAGRVGVAREFADRGIDRAAADRLLDLFSTRAEGAETVPNEALIERLTAFAGAHEGARQGLADLAQVVSWAASTPAGGRLRLDPSLARGLSYYTGTIMEVAVPDLAGSLGGGGRYDRLVGMFLGRDVPACGFSLGLERILVVMQERGMFPDRVRSVGADLLLTQWSEPRVADTLALARELRGAGLRVDVFPVVDKLAKQFKYAASRGVPFVVINGDDEGARGEVGIKDMQSGAQTAVPRQGAGAWVRDKLSR